MHDEVTHLSNYIPVHSLVAHYRIIAFTMSSTPNTPARALRNTPARRDRLLGTPSSAPRGDRQASVRATPASRRPGLPPVQETPIPRQATRRRQQSEEHEERPARRRRIEGSESPGPRAAAARKASPIWSYFSEVQVGQTGKVLFY